MKEMYNPDPPLRQRSNRIQANLKNYYLYRVSLWIFAFLILGNIGYAQQIQSGTGTILHSSFIPTTGRTEYPYVMKVVNGEACLTWDATAKYSPVTYDLGETNPTPCSAQNDTQTTALAVDNSRQPNLTIGAIRFACDTLLLASHNYTTP